MNHEKININNDLGMYFDRAVAEDFARHEQNEKNFRVAQIIDRVIMQEVEDFGDPIYVAELGGGAHPDRYHNFFARLLRDPKGHIDWVDVSPFMLDLAREYLKEENLEERIEVMSFVENDILNYLQDIADSKLDVAIMKYTIDYFDDLGVLFELLSKKLKQNGRFISDVGRINPELRSYSTNARFLYNGEQFPDDEVRILKDGDSFSIKFFKVSGDRNSGCLEGAETIKYFHSAEKMKSLAEMYGFDIYLGNWKGLVREDKQDGEEMNQDILVLRKM